MLGEPEQDANTALTELDRGLRCNKNGEQCEAIVRFPRLFEKYPFPILINSALLKLADVFRTGSNFLRLCVLGVFQQANKHLDKILSIEEFLRKIYSVIHSNDPVARALTLRALASVAVIVSEKKQVHHSIRNALDSHDEVELQAAIFASAKFALYSRNFATNICEKIADMISSLTYPVEIKLTLLSVLQFMHHDVQTTSYVQELLINLLPKYPSQEFVIRILNVLTKLAENTVMIVPEQIFLLLTYLESDPRLIVKCHILENLEHLSITAPHLWIKSNIDQVFKFVNRTEYLQLKSQGLNVLSQLAKSVLVTEFSLEEIMPAVQCLCSHPNKYVSLKAVQFFTAICVHKIQNVDFLAKNPGNIQQCIVAIEALLFPSVCDNETESSDNVFKKLLHCMVSLSNTWSNLAEQIVASLHRLLTVVKENKSILMCDALSSLARKNKKILYPLIPEITSIISSICKLDSISSNKMNISLTKFCILLYQAIPPDCDIHDPSNILSEALVKVTLWNKYLIARQCLRFGHYIHATKILEILICNVSSEHFYFWLLGLNQFAKAESSFLKTDTNIELINQLTNAINYYIKGVSALKAAGTPSSSMIFQSSFAQLRAEMLKAILQLMQSCCTLHTIPPPAIANIAIGNSEGLQRDGRLMHQLKKCSKQLLTVAESYCNLYKSAFDADPSTLQLVTLYIHVCRFLAEIVDLQKQTENYYYSNYFDVMNLSDLENVSLLETCKECSNSIKTVLYNQMPVYKQIQHLISAVHKIMATPITFPRFFFQMIQSTNVKLAVSPQSRVPGEPISVTCTTYLAIKIEGVIQHGKRPGFYRHVRNITVSISSQLQNKGQLTSNLKEDQTTNNMSHSVQPHNDFFTVQFLLHFPVPGLHTVVINCSLQDDDYKNWNSGVTVQLIIKSFDDNLKLQKRANVANRFQ